MAILAWVHSPLDIGSWILTDRTLSAILWQLINTMNIERVGKKCDWHKKKLMCRNSALSPNLHLAALFEIFHMERKKCNFIRQLFVYEAKEWCIPFHIYRISLDVIFFSQNPYYHIKFIWSLLDDDDARFFGKHRLLLVNATFSALLLVCQSTTRKCYDIHMKMIQSKRQKEKNLWKSMQMFATLHGYMIVSGVQSAETGTFSCTCISAPTTVYASTIDTKWSAFNRFIRNTSKAFFGSIDCARCLVCLHTYVSYLFFYTSIALFRSLPLVFIRSFFSFFLSLVYISAHVKSVNSFQLSFQQRQRWLISMHGNQLSKCSLHHVFIAISYAQRKFWCKCNILFELSVWTTWELWIKYIIHA